MLRLLDILLTIAHLAVIVFNLFGWIPRQTRMMNFICIMLTAASWFVLGLWFGMGYCPLTDWQWDVKERLGERNLPGNFVEYFAEKITGRNFKSSFIDWVIAVSFSLAAVFSIYLNFFRRRIFK